MSISSYGDILPLTMIVIGALVFSSALTRTIATMMVVMMMVVMVMVMVRVMAMAMATRIRRRRRRPQPVRHGGDDRGVGGGV